MTQLENMENDHVETENECQNLFFIYIKVICENKI